MKKSLFIFFLILIALAVYLNRAYAHIYAVIGEQNLPNPTPRTSLLIDPSDARGEPLKYVALGDSLTAGVGAATSAESYPYRLGMLIAEGKQLPVSVLNLGVPSAIANDVIEQQILLLKDQAADIVTILVGINDMHNRTRLPVFKQHMRTIVDTVSSPATRVYVFTIPYLGDSRLMLPPYRWYFDWQTKQYNRALREALADKNVEIVDLYALTYDQARSNREYYSSDLFHPSALGYEKWSSIMYAHIHR